MSRATMRIAPTFAPCASSSANDGSGPDTLDAAGAGVVGSDWAVETVGPAIVRANSRPRARRRT